MSTTRILVAGIGNIFLGDDAFGVEVAQRLLRRELDPEVRVVDFGIRGIDLTYALLEGYQAVILVDAAPRGGQPGTLYVIQPEAGDEIDPSQPAPTLEMHNLDPAKVLRLARALGGQLDRVLLVACEPLPASEEPIVPSGLSKPVEASLEKAVDLVESLIARLKEQDGARSSPFPAAQNHPR